MSRSERQMKIEMLSRANRGRGAMHQFVSDLSRALEESVETTSLVNLRETDELLEAFKAGYAQVLAGHAISLTKNFERRQKLLVFQAINCFAERLNEERVLFITEKSGICGAASLRGRQVLKRSEALLALDGNSVSILSEDRSEGFLLDFNPDDFQHVFELTLWGDRWPILALGCLP